MESKDSLLYLISNMCLHVSLRFNYFPKFKCLAAVDLDDFDNKWTTFIILVILAGWWPCRSCSRKMQMSHSWPVLFSLQIKVWQRTFKTNRTSKHKYKPPGWIQIRYIVYLYVVLMESADFVQFYFYIVFIRLIIWSWAFSQCSPSLF